MAVKQNLGNLAPDGSVYVTSTDGAGNLAAAGGGGATNLTQIAGTAVDVNSGLKSAGTQRVVLATDQPQLTSALLSAQSGTWTVQPGNTANTTAWLITATQSATGTITSVASSATDVTILASNANRKGAAVYNDSTQVLYLALASATSSTSVYTCQIPAGGYYEIPSFKDGGVYTGVLKGIWASANGNARVTEWT